MMESSETLIVTEVCKIVYSPYPVCLKKLHQALREQAGHAPEIIDRWAYDHAEQAHSLAHAVIEGLSIWSYSLDILQHLCKAATFRQAVVTSHPHLLNQLLNKANHSQHDFEGLSPVCVLLLSDPLPSSVSLPASTQDFLWRLFENAIKHPTPEHLEIVYLTIDGQPELLEILPQSGLERLRKHLVKMMSHGKTIEDKILTLYSLALMAKIVGRYRTMAAHWAAEVSAKQLLAETETLFVGDRAARTLHLVVLQVILACRHDSVSKNDAVRRVSLARQVIEAMDESTMRSWVGNNPNPINKLQEKMGQSGLHPAVQVEAVAFMTTLLSESQIGSSLAERLQSLVLQPSTDFSSRTTQQAMQFATTRIIGRFNERFWVSCLSTILVQPSQHSESRVSMSRRQQLSLVSWLRTALREHEGATTSASRALFEPELQQKLVTFLVQWSDRTICAFFLELSVRCPSANAPLIMQLVQVLEHAKSEPTRVPPAPVAAHHAQLEKSLTLIEQASTPEVEGISQHWRQRLASELGLEAKHRQHTVIQLVSRVCEDLETRCDTVEEPLRAERARAEQLVVQNEELRQTVSALEGKCSELFDYADAANETRVEAESRAAGIERELETMQARFKVLQREFDEANADAARFLEQTRHLLEQQILELQSNAACQNEKVDGYEAQLKDFEKQLQQKDEVVEMLKEEHTKALKRCEGDLKHSEEALRSRSNELEETQDRLNASNELKKDLQASLTESSNALSAAAARYDELTQDKNHMTDCHEREREAAREKHQTEYDMLVTAVESTRAELEGKLLDQKEATNALEATLRDRDQAIEELQAQVQDYDAELQEKSMQLNEALGLKSNLLSLLNGGIGADLVKKAETKPKNRSPVKLGAISRRRSRADKKASDTPSRRPKTLQVPEPSSTFDGAQDSQSPTSPSPKRTKGQTSFRIPSTKHTSFALPAPSAKLIRSRRSLGLPALGESSASRLNSSRDRRRTDFASSWKIGDAPSVDYSSGAGHDEKNMSDDVTPFSKRCSPSAKARTPGSAFAKQAVSTEDEMYADLMQEDFEDDETTVEV